MPTRSIRHVVQGQTLVTATAQTTVAAAARLMAQAKVGAILIMDGDRLAAIFTERDALNRVLAAGLDPATTPLSAVATPNPMTAPGDRKLGYAMHLMFEGGFRHVPVVDGGRVIGVVSARDMLGPELVEFEEEVRQREAIAEILA